MARHLKVEKVVFPDRSNKTEYYLTFKSKDGKELSSFVHPNDLEKIYKEIKNELGLKYSSSISEEEIDEIISFQNENKNLCFSCRHRMKECERCVLVCESPLEQQLFIGLLNSGLNPQLQVWIARNGSCYPRKSNFSPRDALTRPDFYFETEKGKFCIYADGYTYHNKSEDKVSKDRNIDDQLQAFGYQVIRYTGKDIRENLPSTVKKIKERISS